MSKFAIEAYRDDSHRAQVVALWRASLSYTSPHNLPDLTIEKKVGFKDGLFFVAVDGPAVVGTIMAGYDGHRGWIYSLAVASSRRRRGLGAMLVGHAERALAKLGCVKINLQILEGNEGVSEFYSKLGYLVEKRISMGKRLDENVPTALEGRGPDAR